MDTFVLSIPPFQIGTTSGPWVYNIFLFLSNNLLLSAQSIDIISLVIVISWLSSVFLYFCDPFLPGFIFQVGDRWIFTKASQEVAIRDSLS